MVKDKVTGDRLAKFLNIWDKEVYNLNVELKKNEGIRCLEDYC